MSGQAVAELRKLAHTLDVETERLDMLAGLPADDLRALRAQAAEALFQADRPAFVRVAALTKAVPGPLVAKLTEAVMPPLLAARTAELLEPHRAAELVHRMSDRYVADVSACMDAGRAPELIAAIPAERVAAVAAELARRQEWVVIGGFVAQVTPEALAASVARFDGEQLLRIGFVLDELDRLDEIGAQLTDEQIDDMLAAAARAGLTAELAEVAAHLRPPRLARFAGRYRNAPESVRTTLAERLDAATLERLTGPGD